jgi:hypothetical protein
MLEKLDIQWQVTKTKQISICLLILLVVRVLGLATLLRSLGAVEEGFTAVGMSYYAMIANAVFWACVGIALKITAMVGLHKKMLFGGICAAVVAVLNLATLFFPVSLFIIWYLLPDSVREEITQEIKPLFTKQI